MAKSIILNKEYNKREIYVNNFINRQVYQSFLKDSRISLSERQRIYQKFSKIRYSSSIVRLKNFCSLQGIPVLCIEILNYLGINLILWSLMVISRAVLGFMVIYTLVIRA